MTPPMTPPMNPPMNPVRDAADEPVVRPAEMADLAAIEAFGAAVIPVHYTPLIGAAAADGQLRTWWSAAALGAAIRAGLVVIAVRDGDVVGVGERGRFGDDHVIYKLYVRAGQRGHGLGPRLIDALLRQLSADTERVLIEHFAANVRAAEFYQRQGLTVLRVDTAPGEDRGLDTVWRARDLTTRR